MSTLKKLERYAETKECELCVRDQVPIFFNLLQLIVGLVESHSTEKSDYDLAMVEILMRPLCQLVCNQVKLILRLNLASN